MKKKVIKNLDDIEDEERIKLPYLEVGDEIIIPRIKIYDGINDGSYYFRKIGFTSKITDES